MTHLLKIGTLEGGEGWTDLMQKLHINHGQELAPIDTNDFETTPVIQSIYIQDDGIIQAVSDYRHGGIPDGHWFFKNLLPDENTEKMQFDSLKDSECVVCRINQMVALKIIVQHFLKNVTNFWAMCCSLIWLFL